MTVLAYGTMVYVAEAAAAETGVDAEIIDLRSLVPLDIETIEASVRKTGRCVVVHEATLTSGFGGELSALVQETCFYHLEAPVPASPAGIRLILTRRNGTTSRVLPASVRRC